MMSYPLARTRSKSTPFREPRVLIHASWMHDGPAHTSPHWRSPSPARDDATSLEPLYDPLVSGLLDKVLETAQ